MMKKDITKLFATLTRDNGTYAAAFAKKLTAEIEAYKAKGYKNIKIQHIDGGMFGTNVYLIGKK